MTNEEFLEGWRDVWTAFRVQTNPDVGGLGHATAAMDDQGRVVLDWRLDIAASSNGRPQEANAGIWLANQIVLRDVATFAWTSYRSTEGATPEAAETLGAMARNYASDVRFEPLNAGETPPAEQDAPAKLRIFDGRSASTELDVPGPGPIIPDVLIGPYATTRLRVKSGRWPVRFLSFERDQHGGGRRFYAWRSHVRYAGRKGPQTGLSHTFESDPTPDGRVFSAWVDDSGRFIGIGDEREVHLAAPDEGAARAFLQTAGGM